MTVISCGKKAETDAFGNTVEANEASENKKPEVLGQELFDGKGTCTTCHKPDSKAVGPSIKEIAKIYTEKKASIAKFLRGTEEPIVDPSQFEVMKANFFVTKTMSDDELKAIETYMMTLK